LVLDVDHFKTLNDTLGHGAGDALLQEIATRLMGRVPQHATVARLGGDEFAIILPRYPETEARRDLVAKIILGMDETFSYDGRQVEISLSVGAAQFPADGDDSEALLKSADLALYAAKAQGPGQVRGFEPEFREAAENQKRMLVDARQALTDEQIVPFYQPKICLRSGAIIGFEALLRWHHQERGLQPPAAILAAFDDPRIAPDLTDRMLARILSDMAKWQKQGCDFGRIAINGSREDFRRGDLTDRILGKLAETGVPADRLELEVTETVFLGKHAEDVEAALRTLRRAGVTIALDDFGTGYASLTHLKQFPVDVLKIDQSFISRLVSENQQDAVIVGALIDLAKNLGIQTVAEGVETGLQAFMLRRRGCDIGQGYHFSRPLPAEQVMSFVAQWKPQRLLSDWASAPANAVSAFR
ncbi:MAG: bifunctional diguanylate cyclase/phosphodiesterase, partial [Hyphomicrobiales bacterium]